MFEFPVSLRSGTRGLRLSLPRVQVSHYMVSLVHSTSEEACHAYSLFSLFHLLYFFGGVGGGGGFFCFNRLCSLPFWG